ncbi:MAG: hypothetical protein ACRDQ5_09250 [Sciscionella sp.]
MLNTTEQLGRVQGAQDQAKKEAIATLGGAGLSQRAMADVVGVPHQWVNQLVASVHRVTAPRRDFQYGPHSANNGRASAGRASI